MPELPFSTASWPHRIAALFIDWAASTLVAIVIVGWDRYREPGEWTQFAVLAVFVLEAAVFTALAGGSFGQLATRLRVVRVDGSGEPVGLLRALARSALICLVIPPLVFRPDGRGLHDMLLGTATVPLKSLRGLADAG